MCRSGYKRRETSLVKGLYCILGRHPSLICLELYFFVNKSANKLNFLHHYTFFLKMSKVDHLYSLVINDEYASIESELAKKSIKARKMLINTRSPNHRQTMLNTSIHYGRFDIAVLLIKHGAIVTAKNEHDTPLYFAVRAKNIELVRLLLKKGARVESSGDVRKIVYYEADVELVRLLIENGMRVDWTSSKWPYCPLYSAVKNVEMTELLIKNGAKVNVRI